jgi:filamentous hemagglutinin family protein
MNHLYRIVWNAHSDCWQAVSEIAKGGGKSDPACNVAGPDGSFERVDITGEPRLHTLVLAFAAALMTMSLPAFAGPEGGSVSAGSASISQSGNTTTINQRSDRAAINWSRFSVGKDEAVRFNQPSNTSATLNRVTGTESSQIMGSLSANGHVFIFNPNGVLFGAGAQVNVGGLIATTLDMSDDDFMSGKINLNGESTAGVTNDGDITTEEGGTVVLIAPEVTNNGTISADKGSVVLAGASSLTQTSAPTVASPSTSATSSASAAPSVEPETPAAAAQPAVATSSVDPSAAPATPSTTPVIASSPATIEAAPVTATPAAIAPAPAPAPAQLATGDAKVADQFTVRLQDGSLVGFTIDKGAVSALVSNGGLIKTPGGQVILTAQGRDSLAQASVNQSGVIEAKTVGDLQGNIALSSSHGMVNTGSLNASGGAQGQGGEIAVNTKNLIDAGQYDVSGGAQGGRINIQASNHIEQTTAAALNANASNGQAGAITIAAGHDAFLSSRLHASGNGARGQGGVIHLTAPDLQLAAAIVSATGSQQGGQVAIGGGWQGKDASIANANITKVVGSQIDVSAIDAGQASAGNAGTAVLWSEQTTAFTGTIKATGGAITGDGGMVEISSHDTLNMGGTVDASASQGANGTLLLDPKNIEIVAGGVTGYSLLNLPDPTPSADEGFGGFEGANSAVEVLNNGVGINRIVIASPWDDNNATDTGAARLYDSQTGALISTLSGSQANDRVGAGGVSLLGNGNYLVRSSAWTNYILPGAGAVTFGNGMTGVSGVVSQDNSLVGSASNDGVGASVLVLSNGNYLVRSPFADSVQCSFSGCRVVATNVGAVTFGNGSTGVVGGVWSSNSLMGSTTNDKVGGTAITELSNGNYVVGSNQWTNGLAANAGAATWGSGLTGVSGIVSAENSLVGTTAEDRVGSAVIALSNGNYVVRSSEWANGEALRAGAATWGDGSVGVSGVVSASNSLVGLKSNDLVGGQVTALSNGNYVLGSNFWDNGSVVNAGAATWGDGSLGVRGFVSIDNSLVGSSDYDSVGSVITALSNGNYVVGSTEWDNNGIADAGAATWGDGSTGVRGVVSGDNSLVGSSNADRVGSPGITALSNGNYVVLSNQWDNGGVANAGAATWGNGSTGVRGALTSSNSLVGSTQDDLVGIGVTALSNGNYVVASSLWNNGSTLRVGAMTFGSGETGVSGAVSASNSLVGSRNDDRVGLRPAVELSNGNYVIASDQWDNRSAIDAGAVTWGSGTTGVSGPISEGNSLVGTKSQDLVGNRGITALSNGNYVVPSSNWDNGSATDAGAVTWANGSTGLSGAVTATNSLVGATSYSYVGSGGIASLSNGNYVAISSAWSSGGGLSFNEGAVTWGDGKTGVSGVISGDNSLVGSNSLDKVGLSGVITLTGGNYVVSSSNWGGGIASSVGAATWGNGETGTKGVVSSTNSLVGSARFDQIGNGGITALSDGRALVSSPSWDSANLADAGRADIIGGPIGGFSNPLSYTFNPSADSLLAVDAITTMLNAGTNVVLQANNDITLSTALTANNPGGNGGALTFQAGRSVFLNGSITSDNGDLTVIANDQAANGVVDAYRDAGEATIAMAPGTTIDAGTGAVLLALRDGAGLTHQGAGDITLGDILAGRVKAINSGAMAGAGVVLNGVLATSANSLTAIELAGAGFTNNAGASALGVGTGSRWLVWSGDPDGDAPGDLAPAFTQYEAVYGVSPVAGEGNGLLYSVASSIAPPPPPPPPPPTPTPVPVPVQAVASISAPPTAPVGASVPVPSPVVAAVPAPAPPPDVWPGLLEEEDKATISESNPVASDGEGMRQPEEKDQLVSIGNGS